ncbi:MAG: PHP domain-containing protein, partial [Treponema sp.]|nr:PHP domain-containing protein [Treponema sp.]
MKKTNYHTHSTFCDGKNTPEQIVQVALQKGFGALGFSSHSMYPFSSDWHLQSREHSVYAKEIHRLSTEYTGRLDIKLGFES